jgi:signal transduction histidine kinase
LSYTILYFALPADRRDQLVLLLMLVVLVWVTWASDAMALLLKQVGDHLGQLNTALQENQAQLEARIAERTRQLQEIQGQMLHQEKMAAFGLLAAGIAHEVGNPLTSISSLVQMLQQRDNNPYTQAKLELVNGQLKRIQNTLHELVNFSRPASTERRRLALGPIIEEALNIAKYYKGTKGRVIEAAVPPDLPTFYGVHDQLVQVFLNLVLNAIDATKKGGRIVLQVRRLPGMLQVEIQDDGCGIAPADAAKVFQPYFTTKEHGTGLGLFMTRKLLQDHEGTVDFESEPGEGTTFRVRLPVHDETPRKELAGTMSRS